MVKKSRKGGIVRYTARIVPKTLKATKNVGKYALRSIDNIFIKAAQSVRSVTSRIDRRAAKTIRSITRRKGRK
jgi:hypothetical protein